MFYKKSQKKPVSFLGKPVSKIIFYCVTVVVPVPAVVVSVVPRMSHRTSSSEEAPVSSSILL